MAVQERYLVRARALEGQVGTGRLWKPCPRADSVPASAQIVKLCLDNMGVRPGSTLAPEFPSFSTPNPSVRASRNLWATPRP